MKFKIWFENLNTPQPLPFATLNIGGIQFVTGKPVTFDYLKNTQSAPNFGSMYQQDIEPAGRYIIRKEVDGPVAGSWEEGTQTFQSPLVIRFNPVSEFGYDQNSWKAALANHYGKTGKALSQAIRRDGYDGIVTIGIDNHTQEIVDLTMF